MFAGNRMSDRSGSTRELDHLINRRIRIEVTDDVEVMGGVGGGWQVAG